jgi:hypothetical protein
VQRVAVDAWQQRESATNMYFRVIGLRLSQPQKNPKPYPTKPINPNFNKTQSMKRRLHGADTHRAAVEAHGSKADG